MINQSGIHARYKQKVKRKLTVFLCLGYGFIGLFALGFLTLKIDDPNAPVAVVFPIGFEAHDSFAEIIQANGSPIRYGAAGNIIIAHFDPPSLKKIKQTTNALFIMNPIAAGACFISEEI